MLYLNLVPYTDFQQKNLDWIITKLKEMKDYSEDIEDIEREIRLLWNQVRDNKTDIQVLYGRALPVVTDADNGKILQVVDAHWTAVNLDGNNINY